MYDDYNVRASNQLDVAGILIAEEDLPFDYEEFNGTALTTEQVLQLLESDKLIVMSTAVADRSVLAHLEEACEEVRWHYHLEGYLQGYSHIEQAVAYNEPRKMLFIATIVS